jgi:hypothetical protein
MNVQLLQNVLPYQVSGLLSRNNNVKHGLYSELMRGELLNNLRVVYLYYFHKWGNNRTIWEREIYWLFIHSQKKFNQVVREILWGLGVVLYFNWMH